jgi:hypothetical protein
MTQQKTHIYCSKCDLLIAHQDELYSEFLA